MRREIPVWLGVVIIIVVVLLVGFLIWSRAGQKQIVPASEVLGGPQKAMQFRQRPPGGPGGGMGKMTPPSPSQGR